MSDKYKHNSFGEARRRRFGEEEVKQSLICEASWVEAFSTLGKCGHHPLGRYGPDIIWMGKGRVCFLEVEWRSGWFSDHYPWPTLDVLPRRIENARKYLPIPSILLQSNKDHSSGTMCLIDPDYEHQGRDVEVEDFVFVRRNNLDLEALFYLVDKA